MKLGNFKFKINFLNTLFVILAIYFIFFIFFDLNWGAPFYFHPDERNIASAITQLNLFNNMNPHFFAYGQLPIYFVYSIGLIFNIISRGLPINPIVSFELAIVIGRFICAILCIVLVFLIFKTTYLLQNKSAAFLSFIFASTSVAFFQFSHFGTFEIWLSVSYLLISFSLFNFLKSKKNIYFVLGSIFFGISCSLKLSSLTFLLIPGLVIIFKAIEEKKINKKIVAFIKLSLVFICFSVGSYILTSPFNILDNASFINSMKYESGVATGTLPVFYTGDFMSQIPILYQYEKILPFLINPIITLLSIPAIFYTIYIVFKKKDKNLGIFVLSFLVLFIPEAFLFAKWTRYIIPAIPFLYILVSIFLVDIVSKKYLKPIFVFFVLTGILFSFSYLKTVRINQDTRLTAANFAKKNIPINSNITSEVYDLGIVPFNSSYLHISLFNFYDLDNGTTQRELLPQVLKNSDYIILPSSRIYESRITHPKQFPTEYKFYSDLFSHQLNFSKIYETPCDIFCKLTYFGNPVFSVEQTVNVFDRPTVFIFKKDK